MYSRRLMEALTAGCVLVTMLSSVASEPTRLRRQESRHVYIVDTMVVVDNAMYSWFKQWMMTTLNVPKVDTDSKLKEYVSLIIHQVNTRYAAINGLHYVISFQLVNITMNENIIGGIAKNSSTVDPAIALDTFKGWLKQTSRGNYDHAILLTGYTLGGAGAGSELKGRAYVGKLCDSNGYSASIVQEDGGFQSAHYVSHELAHNLGSDHDGEGQGQACRSGDQFIMAPSRGDSGSSINPWHFSPCSTASMDIIINSITTSQLANCLSSSMTPMPEFTVTKNMTPGQIYPADMQCRMLHGPTSYTCLGSGFVNLDAVCTSMYCYTGLQTTNTGQVPRCALHFAAEGTTCGNKKWCRLGMCVEAAEAPTVSTVCPNGDSPVVINNLFCQEFINKTPSACYNNKTRHELCCASCQAARRPSEACPYGDKVSGCKKSFCGAMTTSGQPYSLNCCGTCSTSTTTTTTPCVDAPSIDGMPCSLRVTKDGRQECYNTSVAQRCCQTCSDMRTSVAGCEYGDRLRDGSCDISPNKTECSQKKKDCCSSCSSYNQAEGRTWSPGTLAVVFLCGLVINKVQS